MTIRDKVKENFRNWEVKEEKIFNDTLIEVKKVIDEMDGQITKKGKLIYKDKLKEKLGIKC